MKRILVTGGAGFIGGHLVDALIEQGAVVSVVDNLFLGKMENVNNAAIFAKIDACNFYEFNTFVQQFKPDLIYNLAVMPLPHSLEYPFENVDVNIKIVQNLCELLRFGVFKRLIHFSSSEVYGSAQYEPICENHPWKASTPYAASKAAGDMICLSYVRTFGCDIKILRPFNNYGPRQNEGAYAGVIPATIRRIRNREIPIIYGDGKQTRDYIYVKDTARAAILLAKAEHIAKGEIINIASGHDYSIDWLVKKIVILLGADPWEVGYQPERPGDVRRHIANVLKSKDLLGFEHILSMDEGLKKTIEWYLTQK